MKRMFWLLVLVITYDSVLHSSDGLEMSLEDPSFRKLDTEAQRNVDRFLRAIQEEGNLRQLSFNQNKTKQSATETSVPRKDEVQRAPALKFKKLDNVEAQRNLDRFLGGIQDESNLQKLSFNQEKTKRTVTKSSVPRANEAQRLSVSKADFETDPFLTDFKLNDIESMRLKRLQYQLDSIDSQEQRRRVFDEKDYLRRHNNLLKNLKKKSQLKQIDSDLDFNSDSDISSDSEVRVAKTMNTNVAKPTLTTLQSKAQQQPVIMKRTLSDSSISWRTDDDSQDASSINFDIVDDTGTNSDSDVRAASSMKTHVQPTVPTAKQQAIKPRKKVTFAE